MWEKNTQIFMWLLSYAPVFIIGLYRNLYENDIENFFIYKLEITSNMVDITIVTSVFVFAYLIYKHSPRYILKKPIKKASKTNKLFQVSKSAKLSLNDYTFFILTLILPLITVDFSKILNLLICFGVILLIIGLLANIEYIIACPLLIFSEYKVWRVDLKWRENSKELIKYDVLVITRNLEFDNVNFKRVKLLNNLYLLVEE